MVELQQTGSAHGRRAANDSALSSHPTLGIEKSNTEEFKKGESNILVAVRLRPLISREISEGQFNLIKILDSNLVVLQDPQDFKEGATNDELRKNRTREKQYAFDYAFDQDVDTSAVFNLTTQFLIPGVMNGYNSTVFAYGATGAGKTHTMLGNPEQPGIMYQTMKEVFNVLDDFKVDRTYEIKVSFLEIYNENIRDLIDTSGALQMDSPDSYLELREDPEKGVCVAGLKEIEVNSAEEILSLLIHGNANRMTESTDANDTSSRSHAVFMLKCSYRDKNSGVRAEISVGKLSLIDLAGSERASKTNNRGIRMIEGANINRSLLALGNCINALHDNAMKNKENYIPYRDSKLTRLLKDSLGGNCRTVMIANVAGGHSSFEETHNTLKYANRAKNIKTNVQKNTQNVEYQVAQYQEIIQRLQSEVTELRSIVDAGGSKSPTQSRSPTLNFPQIQSSRVSQPLVDPRFEQFKAEIEGHFNQETRSKKRIHELEQKQQTTKLIIVNKNNEIAALQLDKGKLSGGELDSRGPIETSQSEPIVEASSPIKINLDTVNNKNEPQITRVQKEIKESEQQVQSMRQTLEDLYKKQRDLANDRAKLKSKFQSSSELPIHSVEMLKLLFRQHILTQQNLDYEHKDNQQELQIKIKEAQTFSLSEQLRIRDEIISNTKNVITKEQGQQPVNESRSMSSRQNLNQESSSLQQPLSGQSRHSQVYREQQTSPIGKITVSAREINAILNDKRMISLNEIIKQNSILPPIIDTSKSNRFQSNMPPTSGRQNYFAIPSKRKQMASIASHHYSAVQNQNTNQNPNGNNVSGGYTRRRMNQNQILLKRNFNLPQVGQARQSPSKSSAQPSLITKPVTIQNYSTNQVTGKTGGGVGGHGLRQSNSTHRLQQNIQKYPDLRRIQVSNGSVSGLSPQINNSNLKSPQNSEIQKPLYSRGHSKIGSGVIRPFQPPSNNHINVSNTLIQQQHVQLTGQQQPRRLRLGVAGGSHASLHSNQQQYYQLSPNQVRVLEEAKRSNSVVSTGDSTNSTRSQHLMLRGIGEQIRRNGSGQVSNSRIGTGLTRGKNSVSKSNLIPMAALNVPIKNAHNQRNQGGTSNYYSQFKSNQKSSTQPVQQVIKQVSSSQATLLSQSPYKKA